MVSGASNRLRRKNAHAAGKHAGQPVKNCDACCVEQGEPTEQTVRRQRLRGEHEAGEHAQKLIRACPLCLVMGRQRKRVEAHHLEGGHNEELHGRCRLCLGIVVGYAGNLVLATEGPLESILCTKAGWKTQEVATEVLAFLRSRGRAECRMYWHDQCDAYHLTSQEARVAP